jgi:hypothetical protein
MARLLKCFDGTLALAMWHHMAVALGSAERSIDLISTA